MFGLFDSDDEGDGSDIGCTGHHFGEYEPQMDVKSKRLDYPIRGYQGYIFKQRHVKECQHHGCSETKETWKAITPKLVGGELEDLIESIEYHGEEIAASDDGENDND